jgi:hypothetical protein
MVEKWFRIGHLAEAAERRETIRRGRLLVLGLVLALPGSGVSQGVAGGGYRPRLPANLEWVSFDRPGEVRQAEQRALAAALAALKPQRQGTVDAYVIVAALNADPVFGREAREAARVLGRRFDAEGRTIVLAAGNGGGGAAPLGSPDSLALALARAGQLADPREDVLVLYTTTHGSAQDGLQYKDPKRGFGWIKPQRLAAMLDGSGMANRLLIISACYSGIFLPRLSSDGSVVISAAASDRASFGCSPGNDWTYFGDAFVNRALRKPQPLPAAFAEARSLVSRWEAGAGLLNSNPQISIGRDVPRWLAPLEKRMPAQATNPVGRSAAEHGAP